MSESGEIQPGIPAQESFATTHWSLVLRASQQKSAEAEEALESLCRSYWYPLYAFVRRLGHSPHDAQDLTQSFFVRLLETRNLERADPARGRFRSFLLASLKNFLVNEWARGQAQRRGGGRQIVSLDEEAAERTFLLEPASESPPESLYDKRWAITLLERAMKRLGTDYERTGRGKVFTQLKPWLLSEAAAEVYRELAASLDLSEGAAKVALHRLRQRFREVVRDEVAQTVETPDEVDEELRCLMEALGR